MVEVQHGEAARCIPLLSGPILHDGHSKWLEVMLVWCELAAQQPPEASWAPALAAQEAACMSPPQCEDILDEVWLLNGRNRCEEQGVEEHPG